MVNSKQRAENLSLTTAYLISSYFDHSFDFIYGRFEWRDTIKCGSVNQPPTYLHFNNIWVYDGVVIIIVVIHKRSEWFKIFYFFLISMQSNHYQEEWTTCTMAQTLCQNQNCIFGLCSLKWWWFPFQSSFLPCHCSYCRSTYVTDDYSDTFMLNTWGFLCMP